MGGEQVLVVGGAGYIGSHVCKALSIEGYTPISFDNLSTGHRWAVNWGPLFVGDLHDPKSLSKAFEDYSPSAVIHLASSINVRESIQNPIKYYHNNVIGTLNLLEAMVKHKVLSLVFSSSAAVYGMPNYIPIDEQHPKAPINVYGKTKWMVEQILSDYFQAYHLCSVSLRYFNASGADESGQIGEAHDPETHLIPLVILTALQKRSEISIFGNEYPTEDGTAIRDYVHVSDLADAHVKALKWLTHNHKLEAINLGTGSGYSVKQILEKVQTITGSKVNHRIEKPHLQEPSHLVANFQKAKQLLGWQPEASSLESIVKSAWNWHTGRK